MMSEEKLYKLLDELSKRPTTSLALNVMELTEETLEKDKEIERLNNIIKKAVKYIGEYKDYCDEEVCDCTPEYFEDLLNILNGRSDE